jgi:hypothetical protein
LNKAERRIEILMRDDDGKPVLETLDAKEDEPDEKPARAVKRRIVFDKDEEESAF